MPRIPLIQARPFAREVDFGRVSPDAYGGGAFRGIGQLGETLQIIQEQSDVSEARRIVAENKNKYSGIIRLNNEQISDPEEFNNTTKQQLDELHKTALENANPRVKRLVETQLADEMQQATINREFTYYRKQKDNVLANFAEEENGLLNDAASQDENKRNEAYRTFGQRLGELSANGFINAKDKQKRVAEFDQKALTRMANNEIEADASFFLRNLGTGKFDRLDPDKRLSLKRSANAAITSAITIQNREQKIKEEAADRELQGLVDSGVTPDVIQKRLIEMSAGGTLDRTARAYWDAKLLKGEQADTPAQAANAQKFIAEFTSAMPTGARVREAWAARNSGRLNGTFGDKGAAQIGNMLIMAEGRVNAEGRAQRSEARAIESHNRVTGAGGQPKMTDAQAAKLLGQNFPYSNPNAPTNPQHKKDVQEYITRTTLSGEDRATVAKEIFEKRQKLKAEDDKRQKAIADAAKTDPKKAAIFERLKGLPK